MIYEGYPFIFQMNDRSCSNNLLEYTMQYRFKSIKSNHTYIVRVERYINHTYCVKFFDKANMSSDNKFSLRTSTFEPRTIVFTVLNIMFDVLQRDSNASFFFIGAEDERDLPGKATRRFRFYSNLVLSAISDKIFEHFRTDHLSLYVLVNKSYVKDMTDYVKRINNYVEQTMFE